MVNKKMHQSSFIIEVCTNIPDVLISNLAAVLAISSFSAHFHAVHNLILGIFYLEIRIIEIIIKCLF